MDLGITFCAELLLVIGSVGIIICILCRWTGRCNERYFQSLQERVKTLEKKISVI